MNDLWVELEYSSVYIFKMIGDWDEKDFRGELLYQFPRKSLKYNREYPFDKQLSRKLTPYEIVTFKLSGTFHEETTRPKEE